MTSLAVGILFGVMPAFKATDMSPAQTFGSGSRSVTSGGGRLRGLLVTGEVATAVLLLFGATLLLRTLMAVASFDRGYRADRVLSLLLDPLGIEIPDRRIAAAVLRPSRDRGDGLNRRGVGRVHQRAAARLL